MNKDNNNNTVFYDGILKDWKIQLFGIRRSIRYHTKRAVFLTKFITLISMISGTFVVASVMNEKGTLSIVLGITIAVLSTASLVFGYSSKEQLHNELKRDFSELEISMVNCKNPNQEILGKIIKKRLDTQTKEPNVVRTLDVLCHNELVIAQGGKNIYNLGSLRSLLRQIDLPFLDRILVSQKEKKA